MLISLEHDALVICNTNFFFGETQKCIKYIYLLHKVNNFFFFSLWLFIHCFQEQIDKVQEFIFNISLRIPEENRFSEGFSRRGSRGIQFVVSSLHPGSGGFTFAAQEGAHRQNVDFRVPENNKKVHCE